MSELPMSAEERLAALERKVSMMWNGGGDLLGTEGYLQIGNSGTAGAQRFDKNGHQLATRGGDVPGIYFLDTLQADPDVPFVNRGLIQGNVSTGTALIEMQAQSQDATGKVYVTTSDTANSANVFLYAFSDDIAETALAILGIRADHSNGIFTLSNAPLYLTDLTDPSPLADGMVWYNTTDNQFKFYEGSTIKTLGGGGMSVKVKEADETVISNATLQDDDELLFAVGANEVFQFEGVLNITTPAAADFRIGITGPTGATGSLSAIYSDLSTGSIDAGSVAIGAAGGLLLISGSVGNIVRFWGGIHNGSTSGNLTLQWAQATSTASNTTVMAGSYIKWQANT